MYGSSCAASRFSIVCCSEPVRTELPRVANVACSVVVHFDRFQMSSDGPFGCCFIGKRQWESVAVKLAAFGFKEACARGHQCWESVPHV